MKYVSNGKPCHQTYKQILSLKTRMISYSLIFTFIFCAFTQSHSHYSKQLFIGLGVGTPLFLLLLVAFIWLYIHFRQRKRKADPVGRKDMHAPSLTFFLFYTAFSRSLIDHSNNCKPTDQNRFIKQRKRDGCSSASNYY